MQWTIDELISKYSELARTTAEQTLVFLILCPIWKRPMTPRALRRNSPLPSYFFHLIIKYIVFHWFGRRDSDLLTPFRHIEASCAQNKDQVSNNKGRLGGLIHPHSRLFISPSCCTARRFSMSIYPRDDRETKKCTKGQEGSAERSPEHVRRPSVPSVTPNSPPMHHPLFCWPFLLYARCPSPIPL